MRSQLEATLQMLNPAHLITRHVNPLPQNTIQTQSNTVLVQDFLDLVPTLASMRILVAVAFATVCLRSELRVLKIIDLREHGLQIVSSKII